MSALGHKQTFAVQNVMSALPQIADMCDAKTDVRFGPQADITPAMAARVTPKLWEMSDMVKVLEDWEAAN
jgi:hypothetical protein